MSQTRRPAAFRLDPPEPSKAGEDGQRETPRKPRAVKDAAQIVVTPSEDDFFEAADAVDAAPPPPVARKGGSRLGRIFLTAFGLLVSLGIGLWADRLIRDMFARSDWLGWLALALAATALLALMALIAREAFALSRLASVERMRRRAEDAYALNDAASARAIIADLSGLMQSHPDTAAGRRTLKELEHDVIDGSDYLRIAEQALLRPLDARAQKLVLDAAKRVSVVTAVSPRALVDVGYVLFEAARLVRRLAELYCGRPGFFGFLRLSRSVIAHLAVTGSMAMGEALVQQVVGHGLAARISTRLGEGVVNGMMTARIGIAAMDAIRPLPFNAVERPGMGDFLKALARFASKEKSRSGK